MTESNEIPLRVAFYLRVSSEDQAEKYGIDLQEQALEGLIRSKGKLRDGVTDAMKRVEIYKDEGISGTKEINERPGFAKLKEDLLNSKGNKPFDFVVVYKLDRFARRLKVLLDIVDFFEERGIGFMSATESIDTSTPFGKAMIGIIGVIAELELENIKARTQGGIESAKRMGAFLGTAPFGYKKNRELRLEVLNEEAEVVKMIFNKFLFDRMSVQQIASYLSKNKYQSPEASAITYGKKKGLVKKKNDLYFWRGDKVAKLLTDEVYTGRYYYNKNFGNKKLPKDKWVLCEQKHTAIINAFMFQRSIEMIERNRKLKPKSALSTHTYTLSGLLRCDSCKDESGMMNWIGSRKEIEKGAGNFSYNYQCGRKNTAKHSHVCNVIPFPAEEIEVYVLNFVKKLLVNPEAVFRYQQKLKSTTLEITNLETERKHKQELLWALPNRRKNLLQQNEDGYIDRDTLQKKIDELAKTEITYRKELNELESRIAKNTLSQSYIKVFDIFKEKYEKAMQNSFDDRKEISILLHTLVESIVVFSRPVTEKDNIAGRKKVGQMIPHKIEIKFRLPQDMLNELVSPHRGGSGGNLLGPGGELEIVDLSNSGFGVKSSVVRPGRELNPPKRFCRPLYNRFTTGSQSKIQGLFDA